MFYEGGLKAAGLARKSILDGKNRDAYKYRGKLLCVLSALMSSLNVDSGRKEVESFFFIYNHLSRLARDAKVEDHDIESFDEIIRILNELRTNWKKMLEDNGIA